MNTLNLASVPATEKQAASILVMDEANNIFCTIYADGRIKIVGEDAELIAPELGQIIVVQQNFDLFFKNIHSYDEWVYLRSDLAGVDMSNFGDPVEWQKEVRTDRNIGQ